MGRALSSSDEFKIFFLISVSKNLQNRIADAQKQMQEIGDNKEMSPEEKMNLKFCNSIMKLHTP